MHSQVFVMILLTIPIGYDSTMTQNSVLPCVSMKVRALIDKSNMVRMGVFASSKRTLLLKDWIDSKPNRVVAETREAGIREVGRT